MLIQPAHGNCEGCECPTPTPAPGEELRYFHYDHQGSPVMITDESGSPTEHIRYNLARSGCWIGALSRWLSGYRVQECMRLAGASSKRALSTGYGEVRARFDTAKLPIPEPGPGDIRYEYTGYEAERTTGLLYANARFYDPMLGSFTSHDPADESWSPYSYVGWDPVGRTDPTGAFVCAGWCLVALGFAERGEVHQKIPLSPPFSKGEAGQPSGVGPTDSSEIVDENCC